MAKEEAIYVIDTSSLIHGWVRSYPFDHFEAFWDRMITLIAEGRLITSVEVLNEIEKVDDGLFGWCEDAHENFSKEIDDEIQEHLAHILGNYPRLVDTVKGRSLADPFVIALARKGYPAYTVISEENFGKTKIPDVCKAEGIRCIKLVDLIKEENWRF